MKRSSYELEVYQRKKRKILILSRENWLSKWLFFAESALHSHGLRADHYNHFFRNQSSVLTLSPFQKMKDISINGLTFNVAGEKAPPDIGIRLLRNKRNRWRHNFGHFWVTFRKSVSRPDIFIVSLQEVDLGRVENDVFGVFVH